MWYNTSSITVNIAYSHDCFALFQLLHSSITTNTVDSMQGAEGKLVFVLLTRSTGDCGFLNDKSVSKKRKKRTISKVTRYNLSDKWLD